MRFEKKLTQQTTTCLVFQQDAGHFVIVTSYFTSIIRLQITFYHKRCYHVKGFLQRTAKLALQAIRQSVWLSVRHTPVLCQNEGTQKNAVFTWISTLSKI